MDREYSIRKYLLFAFLISWVFQIAGSLLSLAGNREAFTILNSLGMFGPLAAVWLTAGGLRKDVSGIAWRPGWKKNFRWWLAGWLLPVALAALGCVIFFLCFRDAFDPTMSEYLIAAMGREAYDLSYGSMTPAMTLVSVLVTVLSGAFLNTLFALGEETGWRGYLYPALKRRMGPVKGRILGGVIWGIWHGPVIFLTGYEYGWSVFNAPLWQTVGGMLLFCLVTTAYGTVLDWLYEKGGSVWVPALGHGAINAAAGMGLYMTKADWIGKMYLGPTPIGLIGGLPFFVLALGLLISKRPGEHTGCRGEPINNKSGDTPVL